MDLAAQLMEALSPHVPANVPEAIVIGYEDPHLRPLAAEALKTATPSVRWATAFERWRTSKDVIMALAVGFPVESMGLRLHLSPPILVGPPTLAWGSWVRAVSIPLQLEGSSQTVQLGVGLWPEIRGGVLQIRGQRIAIPDPFWAIEGLADQLAKGTLADLLLHNLARHPAGDAAEVELELLSEGANGLLEGTFDALADRLIG